jgi:hypothetical protein
MCIVISEEHSASIHSFHNQFAFEVFYLFPELNSAGPDKTVLPEV